MAGLSPHPNFAAIRSALSSAIPSALSPFKATLYRACDPSYANTTDLLSGHGSRQYGGRWNPPNSFTTVYLATTFDGALAETVGVSTKYGFDPATRLPITLVAIEASLSRILDLTNPRVRMSIRTTITAMSSCDWKAANTSGQEALTQAIGRAAFECSAEGILVPSAVKRNLRNLNVFPSNLLHSSHLRIHRADRLPKPPGTL